MFELQSIVEAGGLPRDSIREAAGFESVGVWTVSVPGERALEYWERFRKRVGDTGHWPVILGGPYGAMETLVSLAENLKSAWTMPDDHRDFRGWAKTPSATIALAEETSFETWLGQRRDPSFMAKEYHAKADYMEQISRAAPMAEFYRKCATEWETASPPTFDRDSYEWPTEEISCVDWSTLGSLKIHADEFGRNVLQDHSNEKDLPEFDFAKCGWRFPETASIFLVPTARCWETPAYLYFGDLAEGRRPPQVHVAAGFWLHRRYGAQLLGLTDSELEFTVSRPPTTRNEAIRLAEDLTTYASGIATGDVNSSVPEVASCLMKSDVWSFYFE